MGDIDQEKLINLRWGFAWRLADPRRDPNPDKAMEIRRDLAAMGLDLNDDATYELISDGLTKQKFDDLESLSLLYFITNTFYNIRNLSWPQYGRLDVDSKHSDTKTLLGRIDYYKERLDKLTLPANADPDHCATLKMLMDDYGSGKLQEYCIAPAFNDAIEIYRCIREGWDEYKKKPDNKDTYLSLSPIRCLKEILSGMTPDQCIKFFEQTGTNQADLDEIHREEALAVIRRLVSKTGLRSNSSKSFYGFPNNPHAYAVWELEAAGFDMNDDTIYEAIGMDRQTFRNSDPLRQAWGEVAFEEASEPLSGHPSPTPTPM